MLRDALDSNQLRQADHMLAIPQMVLDEQLGYQEHEVQAAVAALRKPAQRLSRLFEENVSCKIPGLDEANAVRFRREAIEAVHGTWITPEQTVAPSTRVWQPT
jgi:hypothetical protein